MELQKVKELFERYAEFGARRNKAVQGGKTDGETLMDATRCVKLAKDCNILDKNLNKNDIDITFQKAKAKGQRKINLKQFLVVLDLWAARKGIHVSELIQQLIMEAPRTPRFNGATQPKYVELHDDESTYTGVYKRGGPAVITKTTKVSLDTLLDRSPADIRGRKVETITDKMKATHISDIKQTPSTHLDDNVALDTSTLLSSGGQSVLHPDWQEVVNPNATGKHDAIYYVNQHTLETTWKKPTVALRAPPVPAELLKTSLQH